MRKMKIKTPSESETVKTEVVFPNDTNPMGILQGGHLVQWMDTTAAVCAQTHAGKICVTASIDSVNFKAPAKLGDIIIIKAKITRAFTSSMEIFVQTHARNVLSEKKNLINEAYFTFVALDNKAKPTTVPLLKPVTNDESEQYKEALTRKKKK
ncbi:acyl-CoA thioesterase [Panacibacter ginsenosidivorans]|uniref:Acyl-CoA thioesterase n=1 Tax=Panacibacter ginsenosidivorans TaxID=1813871 RepID=A0A5B8VFB9_9BACT|nr:acyl-CoA thioesterase [Panacibacter ginsenosidivorans]QEC69226.1 acyl-CoA thioesterase [Panacibacter ginsenosidivorans]